MIENYEHFFLSCQYLDNFWEKITQILEQLMIGRHVLNLKSLVFGYKIEDKDYFCINFILTIMLFSIHKSYYLSEQKTKKVHVFEIFKQEFLNAVETYQIGNYVPKLIKKLKDILKRTD